MASNDTLQIVCCVDDNFCLPLGVLIQSLIDNTTKPVHVHLLHSTLSDDSLSRLGQIDCLTLYDVSTPELLGRINPNIDAQFASRLSVATYFRFLLPWVLPVQMQRVLFLDADMLAVGDVAPLYVCDLDGDIAAVVKDAKLSGTSHFKELGLTEDRYFNAGMMLIDLCAWRNEDISEACLAQLDSGNEWLYNDQDILNLVLQKRCRFVSSIWNTQSHGLSDDSLKSACIVHFTGAEKPWHASSIHPATAGFRETKARSVYADRPLSLHLDRDDQIILSRLGVSDEPLSILIYGCGQRGRRLFHHIQQHLPHIDVKGFVDRAASQTYHDLPVHTRVPVEEELAILIGSVAFRDEISSTLREAGIAQRHII